MGAVTQIAILEQREWQGGFVIVKVRSDEKCQIWNGDSDVTAKEGQIREIFRKQMQQDLMTLDLGGEGVGRDESIAAASFKSTHPKRSCSKVSNLRGKGLRYPTCYTIVFFVKYLVSLAMSSVEFMLLITRFLIRGSSSGNPRVGPNFVGSLHSLA